MKALSYHLHLEPLKIFFSVLAPENTHLAPDLKTRIGDFTFYLKVAFGNTNGSLHSPPSWRPAMYLYHLTSYFVHPLNDQSYAITWQAKASLEEEAMLFIT
jgi:hypothetical protein